MTVAHVIASASEAIQTFRCRLSDQNRVPIAASKHVATAEAEPLDRRASLAMTVPAPLLEDAVALPIFCNGSRDEAAVKSRSNPLTSPSAIAPNGPTPSRWGVFGNVAFTVILIVSCVSAVGIAMFDTAMSWLMTRLNPNPLMVSAVQVATMAPMFLLTVPAGALADVADPRRLLIAAQVGVVAVGAAFAVLVAAHWETPAALLATTFLLGAAGALAAPAWQMIAPMLVPKAELDSAIAFNNAGYNVSHAIGPALGGLAIAAVSMKLPFGVYVATNLGVLAALLWWRLPRKAPETLPAERLVSAMAVGLRYARNNRDLDATLIRAVAFFPFASAYWALMPLVARTQLHDGAELYGLLMALLGLGSIVGSLRLEPLKARLGPDGSAALGTLGTILALLLFAAARIPVVAMVASFVAGASWIVVMTTMFVSAQVALPDWVRGRGLAIFLTAYFGAMTVGSALWGEVANSRGNPLCAHRRGGGRGLGVGSDLALPARNRRGARSRALHALARARLRAAARGRPGADSDHRRIPHRSEGLRPSSSRSCRRSATSVCAKAPMRGTSSTTPRSPAASSRRPTSVRCWNSNTAAPARPRLTR